MNDLQNAATTRNRPASSDEQFHAYQTLLSLGEGVVAEFVKNARQFGMEEYLPLVVSDFSEIGEHKVLLVGEGNYEVPKTLLESSCYIIGLPVRRTPVLQLMEGKKQQIIDADSGKTSWLTVITCGSVCKFAGLKIDAPQPTVLEIFFYSYRQFSDYLFQVECGPNLDVLNSGSFVFLKGQPWAMQAYGENTYRARNMLEKTLDSLHETALGAIDSVFRPLVSIGEKLDKVFDLK